MLQGGFSNYKRWRAPSRRDDAGGPGCQAVLHVHACFVRSKFFLHLLLSCHTDLPVQCLKFRLCVSSSSSSATKWRPSLVTKLGSRWEGRALHTLPLPVIGFGFSGFCISISQIQTLLLLLARRLSTPVHFSHVVGREGSACKTAIATCNAAFFLESQSNWNSPSPPSRRDDETDRDRDASAERSRHE